MCYNCMRLHGQNIILFSKIVELDYSQLFKLHCIKLILSSRAEHPNTILLAL